MENKQGLFNHLIHEYNGIIFTKTLTEAGISRNYLAQMVQRGKLERVERGVYLTRDTYDDEMYRLQHKYGRAIFSHDTALFLHDLSDREPITYHVTVPSGYNAGKLKEFPATVFFINKELYSVGISEHITAFEHSVVCYDRERSICDVIRSRSDIAIVTDALKRYSEGKWKNIPRLMEYAEKFHVIKPIRSYLEVLL